MAKQIAKLLKTNAMGDLSLPALAQLLQSKGRQGDSILAHISPKEAALLKKRGGAGTENPDTGLPEFYDGFEDFAGTQQDIINTISPPSYDYQAPLNSSESSFAVDYGAPAQQLTPSGIDPTEYYAGQQYAGSAFPYPSAQAGTPDVNWSESVAPGSARGIALQEFPPESAAYLNLSSQPGVAEEIAGPTGLREAIIQAKTAQEGRAPVSYPGRVSPGIEREAAPLPAEKEESGYDKLKRALGAIGINPKIGVQTLIGGGGGVKAAMDAQKRADASTKEQKDIGTQYQDRGRKMQEAAIRGELTPANMQTLQAAQAQMQQGVEQRGGVGAQQMANQMANIRATLLQGQYADGQSISAMGDQIVMGAIRTGMTADQYVAQMTQNAYANIGRIMGGTAPEVAAAQQRQAPTA